MYVYFELYNPNRTDTSRPGPFEGIWAELTGPFWPGPLKTDLSEQEVKDRLDENGRIGFLNESGYGAVIHKIIATY